MSVRIRIETIRLIEKMEQNRVYSQKLDICNVSTLHGSEINTIDKEEKPWNAHAKIAARIFQENSN